MSQPTEAPEPAYAQVQLSGPPEAVAGLMAALGGASQIIFDHRADPDTRGNVSCTARVVVLPPPAAVTGSTQAEVVVQSTLSADTARWPGLDEPAGIERFEAAAAAALDGLDGVDGARSRVVAVTRSPVAPASGDRRG
ncbi:hypothetical protein [Streptomyces griseorubiginosus]|uniref:hypothetical protein n=1 Tax=Streptomyces griseorubiginosus TaxID=67304 RepID=UPI0036E8A3B1